MLTRRLIVNADDLGRTAGINRGIILAHERGVVTSASLMVRWPTARLAAEYSRTHREFDLGLHLDLGEWSYVDGAWHTDYEVVPSHDEVAVAREVANQLAMFRSLLGSEPSHLDSHQHVHRDEPVRSALLEAGNRLGIPVRACGEIRYRGDFYGQTAKGASYAQGINYEALIDLLADLAPGSTTELGCHPGCDRDLDSGYCAEREVELQTLCDPRLRGALRARDIVLTSFRAEAVHEMSEGTGRIDG